jgi:hypothetical protein
MSHRQYELLKKNLEAQARGDYGRRNCGTHFLVTFLAFLGSLGYHLPDFRVVLTAILAGVVIGWIGTKSEAGTIDYFATAVAIIALVIVGHSFRPEHWPRTFFVLQPLCLCLSASTSYLYVYRWRKRRLDPNFWR